MDKTVSGKRAVLRAGLQLMMAALPEIAATEIDKEALRVVQLHAKLELVRLERELARQEARIELLDEILAEEKRRRNLPKPVLYQRTNAWRSKSVKVQARRTRRRLDIQGCRRHRAGVKVP